MQTELHFRIAATDPSNGKDSQPAATSVATSKVRIQWARIIATLAFGPVITGFLFVLLSFPPYYTASPVERPHLAEHAWLKPSGRLGHAFGIMGSCMLLSLLAYSARKRFRFMRNWGSVRAWLGVHIFFGISGPLLITLHTAFKFNGIVAVSYWSMVAVMFSGFVGRYLYAQIPHDIRGMELSLQDAQRAHRELVERLRGRYGVTVRDIAQIESYLLGNLRKTESLAKVLLLVLIQDLTRWWRLLRVRRLLRARASIGRPVLLQMIHLVRQETLLRRQLKLFQTMHRAFHYWHVIHKPFAYVMLSIMFMHIAVAVAFGYWWIFE